jgi:hypothetical protein
MSKYAEGKLLVISRISALDSPKTSSGYIFYLSVMLYFYTTCSNCLSKGNRRQRLSCVRDVGNIYEIGKICFPIQMDLVSINVFTGVDGNQTNSSFLHALTSVVYTGIFVSNSVDQQRK